MAYTITAAFEDFYNAINLLGDHRNTANKRRDHIISLLKDNFTINESFPSGSISRFTAVRNHADVDVVVALHYGKHIKGKKPSIVLKNFRDALGKYKTNVRKNGQAVTLYYDTWPNVDIVPASQVTGQNGEVTYYNIPDMNTETWIASNPKSHSQDIESRSSVCGQSFRKIIKMIKWWNKIHSDYLQSYHIEIMALNTYTSNLSDMPWDVYQYFNNAVQLAGSPLWHGYGYVDDYLNYEMRREIVKRLGRARDTARDAWSATYGNRNDHKEAILKWKQIFGDKFPIYG